MDYKKISEIYGKLTQGLEAQYGDDETINKRGAKLSVEIAELHLRQVEDEVAEMEDKAPKGMKSVAHLFAVTALGVAFFHAMKDVCKSPEAKFALLHLARRAAGDLDLFFEDSLCTSCTNMKECMEEGFRCLPEGKNKSAALSGMAPTDSSMDAAANEIEALISQHAPSTKEEAEALVDAVSKKYGITIRMAMTKVDKKSPKLLN